jgi:hypothetical protein
VRKIKSYFFISLDGVVESPDKWYFSYFDDEMGARGRRRLRRRACLADGPRPLRRVGAWLEHADQQFGDVMNSIKKYVVSNSLETAEWQNSEIISGDAAQKVTDTKAADGGDINMSGSATPSAGCCARASLTGSTCSSTRSWSATAWLACFRRTSSPSLELLGAQTLKTGVLNLSYAPAKD